MHFTAELQLGGRTATGIVVPPEVVEALGAGRKPPVVVTINGHSYESTVASRGGLFLLPVSAENRAGAGIAAGDTVEVHLTLDTSVRTVAVPDDLAAALAADPEAQALYDALSPSHRKAWTTWVEGAKAQETRDRRVADTAARLKSGKKQP